MAKITAIDMAPPQLQCNNIAQITLNDQCEGNFMVLDFYVNVYSGGSWVRSGHCHR